MDTNWKSLELRVQFETKVKWDGLVEDGHWETIQYDSTDQTGYVNSDTETLSFGPSVLVALITPGRRQTSGVTRAVRSVLTRMFKHTDVPSADIMVNLVGVITVPKEWSASIRRLADAIKTVEWWGQDLSVDYTGVKYYVRDRETSSALVLDVTPGFVETQHILVRVSVFHDGLEKSRMASFVEFLRRTLSEYLPRIVEVKDDANDS